MTIQLTRAQMKMLSPKARSDIEFENKWRKTRTIHLFVRDDRKDDWSLLNSATWASEREHDKLRTKFEMMLQGWQQNYGPFAQSQFKIVEGAAE